MAGTPLNQGFLKSLRRTSARAKSRATIRSAPAAAAHRPGKTGDRRRRRRRAYSRTSWLCSLSKRLACSKPLARVGVADGGGEKDQPKGQHHQIQHGILRRSRALRRPAQLGRELHRSASFIRVLKCHSAHRFSRLRGSRPYKKLIKTAAVALSAAALTTSL